MMVQCSLFCVFFYQLLEKKNNNNNQTNHQKGSGALNLGKKKNKTKYMGHKMTALTLRFSSICVMACKVVQRGVNITQLRHQLTVGYTTTRHHEKGFVFIHRGE